MTLQELSRYHNLLKKIEQCKETRASLWSAATAVTSTVSDMPRAPGVNDKLSKHATQIADLDLNIKTLENQAEEERQRVLAYVRSIVDGYVRVIFSLRFIEGMTWQGVAEATGSSSENVKKICYRHINSEKLSRNVP